MQNGIQQACLTDIPQIKALWKECFIADSNYISMVFDYLFTAPSTEVYIYKENGLVLSSLFTIQITFKTEDGIFLKGKYLYGVATTATARGRKLSIQLVEHISLLFKNIGDAFIIAHPASESLFNFYKMQGFTIELSKEIFIMPNNILRIIRKIYTKYAADKLYNANTKAATLLFNYIAQTYPKRFEWSIQMLNYMIYLGEFESASCSSLTTSNTPFILVKPLTDICATHIYNGTFFNFTME
ncbi:MAG: GNAT family N-acetyltransferase [Bacteroidales bacterium]